MTILSVDGRSYYMVLTTASLFFFLISVPALNISYFPANPFHYVQSLPITYWIGLGITLWALARLFRSGRDLNNTLKLGPVMILALYLHLLPVMGLENVRYMDAYGHISSALSMTIGSISSSTTYGIEYPGLFVSAAQALLITGLSPMALMRIFYVLITLFLVLIIYLVARDLGGKYAWVAPMALISVLWVEGLHFSPQAFALILFAVVWLAALKIIIKRTESRRSWLVIVALSGFVLIISHPLTPLFMLLAFSTFFVINRILHAPIPGHVLRFLFLGLASFWIYNFLFPGTLYPVNVAQGILTQALNPDSLAPSAIPANPSTSYSVVNWLQVSSVLFVGITGLIILGIMLRSKWRSNQLLLTSGIFIGVLPILPILVYAESTFLQRGFLFIVLSWSVLLPWFLGIRRTKQLSFLAVLMVSFVFLSAITLPILKYSSDPFTYIPSSGLHGADFTISYAEGTIILFPLGKQAYEFASALDLGRSGIGDNDTIPRTILRSNSVEASRALNSSEYFAVLIEYTNASFLLRESEDYLENHEPSLLDRKSLVFNSGTVRIYSR